MKELKAKPGAVIKIPVKDGVYVYAQLLEKGYLAIFDCFVKDSETKKVETILGSKVIFSPTIFDGVKTKIINKGIWEIVDITPLKEEVVKQIRPRFHYNERNKALLHYDGTEVENANPETFYGLFPISVYNEYNVQKLVSAYYEDRYSVSEVLAFLQVYYKGTIPYGIKIPKFYFTMSRSRPLPKPHELEGDEKEIWEEANNKAIKEHYELVAKLRGGS
jgi:hypothetical protein